MQQGRPRKAPAASRGGCGQRSSPACTKIGHRGLDLARVWVGEHEGAMGNAMEGSARGADAAEGRLGDERRNNGTGEETRARESGREEKKRGAAFLTLRRNSRDAWASRGGGGAAVRGGTELQSSNGGGGARVSRGQWRRGLEGEGVQGGRAALFIGQRLGLDVRAKEGRGGAWRNRTRGSPGRAREGR